MEVTLGGERLGSGNRNKIHMHNYERSTHDLSFVWRSTMASGTLVPFMTLVALPGDTFDIDLQCDVLTHPTIGPLFGTYGIQLDVFQIPIRLYQAQLHMNMLNIGRDMSKVLLPQLILEASNLQPQLSADNQQINPSCILSYLGIRGIGFDIADATAPANRNFNAIPFLGYWDIYKNYYANKQEEIGVVIHKTLDPAPPVLIGATVDGQGVSEAIPVIPPFTTEPVSAFSMIPGDGTWIAISATGITTEYDLKNLLVTVSEAINYSDTSERPLTELFTQIQVYPDADLMIASNPDSGNIFPMKFWGIFAINQLVPPTELSEPKLLQFPLVNIDNMRTAILQHNSVTGAFYVPVTGGVPSHPYDLPFLSFDTPLDGRIYTKQYGQEGLAIKTYKSDLFNNWISTEWIDGADGISEITRVGVGTEGFTIDELNLSQKIYNMLNRIALSGGSYDDWLDAVYTHQRTRSAENPIYLGGLMKNLVFQEVVSNSRSLNQPLGTLAGRGKIGGKHKGGKIVAKVDEPSYLMGIIHITPNIDYSQGNQWDVNLKTMNDFHKPALDAIGFQDLITDQMAWWDTRTDKTNYPNIVNTYTSAGKQPAWINYMTAVNVVRGNFAEQNQQMFMTLNRRYTPTFDPLLGINIADLTTYIDPVKFNHIFADTSRDAQNFWAQIAVNIEARRKMSAKVIPNL